MEQRTRTPRRASLAASAVALAAGAMPAAAADFMSNEFIVPGEETFTIYLGGIVNQFDTTLRLDGQSSRGTDINLENNGLKKNLSSVEAAFTWRFLPRHRLDLLYFSVKRSGSHDYAGEIDIGGTTFPVGASVGMSAKDDLFNAVYRYSYVKTPEYEMAIGLGLYGGKLTYDINAAGNDTAAHRTFNKSVSTTLPLPLLAATFEWYPDRQWRIAALLEGMKANISDVDGHAYIVALSGEYMFTRNLGAGLRYTHTDLGADVNKTDFNGTLGWKASAVSFYGKFMF